MMQLPFAMLLLEKSSFNILKANLPASSLVGLTINSLEKLNLSEITEQKIVANLVSNSKNSEGYPIKIQRVSGEPIEVFLNLIQFQPESNLIGLVFQNIETMNSIHPESKTTGDFWHHLSSLLTILELTNQEKVYDKILEEISFATGSGIAGLYLGDQEQPVFKRVSMIGNEDVLPLEVFSNDLPAIQNPFLWQPGNRTSPITNLTMAARTGHFSYMASIPVTRSGALIGLLVLADAKKIPPSNILSSAGILANFIYSFIQVKLKFSSLKQELVITSEKTFSNLITDEFIREGLVELSPDFKIRKINSSAENVFGFTNDEVKGQPVEKILISSESLIPMIENTARESVMNIMDRVRLFRRNGEDFYSRLRFLPVSTDISKEIIILIEDLSEQDRLQKQTKELEHRAELGEVMATFAHEVRNPINNISTGLQLMSRNLPEGDPNQAEISRLLQDCDRLAELMSMVLSLSKQANYSLGPIDLTPLFKRIINRRLSRLENTRIWYDLHTQPNTPFALGDMRALEQVFTNLINNSIQAMSETGGNLVIRIQPGNGSELGLPTSEECIEVSIADTGPGIPEEIQDKIFQPFYTTTSTGTGLGLSIVKRIVSLHNGTIKLESFPGGTIFRIFLHIYKPEPIKIG